MVRKSLLSAAVLGLILPHVADATPRPAPAGKKPAARAAARKGTAPKPAARKPAATKPVAAKPAPASSGEDTCEFQVRTRSRVGYRGMTTYWVKGDWVREEKRTGGGMELIMVSNQNGLFIRNKHSNYWFRYPDEMAFKLRERLLGGPVGEVQPFLKKVKAAYLGKEKVDGVMCNIWSYRLKGADDRFRLWTDLANTRPIRLERDHLIRGTKKRDVLVVEYRKYQAGQKLADSLFQIPEGEKIHDLRDALNPERFRSELARENDQKRARKAPRSNTPASAAPAAPETTPLTSPE